MERIKQLLMIDGFNCESMKENHSITIEYFDFRNFLYI